MTQAIPPVWLLESGELDRLRAEVLRLRRALAECEQRKAPAVSPVGEKAIDADALAALRALGFGKREAEQALKAAGGTTTTERVALALQQLG